MASIAKILADMRQNPAGIRYAALVQVCDHYFQAPRAAKGSHRIYKTPWAGNPRINIQNDRGFAKAYQVRQVLEAIERLEAGENDEKR